MKKKWLLLFLPLVAMVGIGTFLLRSRPEPQYCWLVFGPEGNVRFLVCLMGEAVSLDQYANGEPTGRKERFRDRSECKGFTIADPDERTCYVITGMSGTITRTGVPTELFVDVDVEFPSKNENAPPIRERYSLDGFC